MADPETPMMDPAVLRRLVEELPHYRAVVRSSIYAYGNAGAYSSYYVDLIPIADSPRYERGPVVVKAEELDAALALSVDPPPVPEHIRRYEWGGVYDGCLLCRGKEPMGHEAGCPWLAAGSHEAPTEAQARWVALSVDPPPLTPTEESQPDLLAALQLILDDAVGQPDDPLWIVQNGVLNVARAAILRAHRAAVVSPREEPDRWCKPVKAEGLVEQIADEMRAGFTSENGLLDRIKHLIETKIPPAIYRKQGEMPPPAVSRKRRK